MLSTVAVVNADWTTLCCQHWAAVVNAGWTMLCCQVVVVKDWTTLCCQQSLWWLQTELRCAANSRCGKCRLNYAVLPTAAVVNADWTTDTLPCCQPLYNSCSDAKSQRTVFVVIVTALVGSRRRHNHFISVVIAMALVGYWGRDATILVDAAMTLVSYWGTVILIVAVNGTYTQKL